MILTTAPAIEGKKIMAHYGIVSSETILRANIFKDFLAGVRDIVGGRSGAYKKSLPEAKEIAMRELTAQAQALGANAVIAIDLDYETLTSGGGISMLMVADSGTAVRYEER
jgi:uncharacterized protein YbjQ (UPF0145 family)